MGSGESSVPGLPIGGLLCGLLFLFELLEWVHVHIPPRASLLPGQHDFQRIGEIAGFLPGEANGEAIGGLFPLDRALMAKQLHGLDLADSVVRGREHAEHDIALVSRPVEDEDVEVVALDRIADSPNVYQGRVP